MFLYLIIVLSAIAWFYIKWQYTYWQRQGFPYVKPKIPSGVLGSVLRRERSIGMAIYDVYKARSEPFIGIYLFSRPALLVRDAALSRDILGKDFISFHDRGIYVDEKHYPLNASLLNLQGQRWKTLRTKLAPSFTSGKLKGMFGTVEDVASRLVDHLNTVLPEDGSFCELEMKKILSTYIIDIIASVIFGLEVDSFKDPKNQFYCLSKIINEPTFSSVLRGTCQFLYPSLENVFVRFGWIEDAPKSMRRIVSQVVEFRESNNISRKDMLQMLLQLRNTGKINADDDVWTVETAAEGFKAMSIDSMTANLLLFYIAGFETSASTTAFTIYELTKYPELLEKARKDVAQAIEKHGKLSYEALQDMKFLDLCIMETIRKYPGLPILNRQCTEDYTIPNTKYVIKKGTPIVISLFGMHRDPEYFPNPLKYDPERFLEENMNYNPIAYMPFGEGPRHCIAQRMGKINVKVALANIFTNFNISVSPDLPEIEIDNYGIPIMPKGGINARLSRKIIAEK